MSGPILIFDKSALESLSGDEAVWLDNFFITNITPLFFIEVLADLEKQVRAGRTPEEVVGNLAYKTPDLQSSPNAHHRTLLNGELLGIDTVVMDGRGILTGARPVTLEGSTGLMFPKTPEQEAFERWQRREFLDLERQDLSLFSEMVQERQTENTCGREGAGRREHRTYRPGSRSSIWNDATRYSDGPAARGYDPMAKRGEASDPRIRALFQVCLFC